MDESGVGEITIYKYGSQTEYDQMYNLTADTKYYTINRGDVVESGNGAITDGHSSDYDSATEVLVISYDDKVEGVYIVTAD